MLNCHIINEHLGSYNGQSNFVLVAKLNGENIGYVSYSEYNEKPHVNYIEVNENWRRKGVGTKLLLALQSKYPRVQINFGYTTEDGTRLLHKVLKAVNNPVYNQKLAKKVLKLEFRINTLTEVHKNVVNKMRFLYFKEKAHPLSNEENVEYLSFCEQDMQITSRLNDLHHNHNKLTTDVDMDVLRVFNRLVKG